MSFGISAIGIILYLIYPISVIAVSIYVSRKEEMTVENYFFSNRKMHWVMLGVSLLTTSFFSPYMLGLTASMSDSAFPVLFAIIAAVVFTLLGLFSTRAFAKIKINTLPEYFEKRFNKSFRYYLAGLYTAGNIFIRLMIILVIGRLAINLVTGIDGYSSLLFFLVIAGVYVIIGGLQAEMYSNVIQLILIALVMAAFAVWIIGRGDSETFIVNNNISFSQLKLNSADLSITGLIVGLPIVAFSFWCADQLIVQKLLSTSNKQSAHKAVVTTGVLQLIPVILFLLPAAIILTNPRFADPLSVFTSVESLPPLLRGGLIIGLAAALMASFASVFNSTSALITLDFYLSYNPDASDRKLVLVARMTTMILLFCAILLIPVTQIADFGFCLTLFKVFSYFISVIAAIFIISLVNRKINSAGAIICLTTGTFIILLQTIAGEFYKNTLFENDITNWFIQPGFLEFSVFIFMFSVLILFVSNRLQLSNAVIGIQKFTKKIFLTLAHPTGANKAVLVMLSALLLIIIVSIIFI